MASQKFKGRQFINPLNRQIGRRTGRNIKAGKNIRIRPDGFENFDDYLSESDADLTREVQHLKHISEEECASGSSQDEGKENECSNVNPAVSQNSTVGLSQSNTMSTTQSMLSQNSQVNSLHRSRFGWLFNRNIGRRTGKDLRANKQIRVDANGFENFDDFLSESDTSSYSNFNSPMSVARKRRSQILEKTKVSDRTSREEKKTSDDSGEEAVTKDGTEVETEDGSNRSERSEEQADDSNETESQKTFDHEIDDMGSTAVKESENEEERKTDEEADEIEKQKDEEERDTEETDEVEEEKDEEKKEDHETTDEEKKEDHETMDEEKKEDHETITESNSSTDGGHTDEISNTGTCGDISEETEEELKADVSDKPETDTHSTEEEACDDNSESMTEEEDTRTHSVPNGNEAMQVGQNVTAGQTGIDVVGNKSGSITKLEIRSQPNSAVSFNKTKKRLSYSAAELSEEGKKSRRSRVDRANKDLENTSAVVNPVNESAQSVNHPTKGTSKPVIDDKLNEDNVSVASASGFLCLASRSTLPLTVNKSENSAESDEDIYIVEETKTVSKPVSKRTKQRGKNKEPAVSIKQVNTPKENEIRPQKGVKQSKSELKGKKTSHSEKSRRKTTHGLQSETSVDRKHRNRRTQDDAEVENVQIDNDDDDLVNDIHMFENESEHDVSVSEELMNTISRVRKAKSETKNKKASDKGKRRRKTVHDEAAVGMNVSDVKVVNDKNLGEEHNIEVGSRKTATLNSKHLETDNSKSEKKRNGYKNSKTQANVSTLNESDTKSVDDGSELVQSSNRKSKKQKERSEKSPTKPVKSQKLRKSTNRKSSTEEERTECEEELSPAKKIRSKAKSSTEEEKTESDEHVSPIRTRKSTRHKSSAEDRRTESNKRISPVKKKRLIRHKSSTEEERTESDEDMSPVKERKSTKRKSSTEEETTESDKQMSLVKKREATRHKSSTEEEKTESDKRTSPVKKRKSSKRKSSTEEEKTESDKQTSPVKKRKSSKRKSSTEEEKTESDEDMSPVKEKKSTKRKSSTEDERTGSEEQMSLVKKRESTNSERLRKRKSSGRKGLRRTEPSSSSEDGMDIMADNLEQEMDVPNSVEQTPRPDSIVSAPTNFGSGVSFRVSRRSEMLENINSGPGCISFDNEPITVQMEATSGLTPCISRPGKSRKSRGRRVTICPEENLHHDISPSKDEDGTPKIRPFRHSYGVSGTPLPSINSTPLHLFEMTHTNSSIEDSVDYSGEDRLIIPEPAPDGLRRSQRTRVKPLNKLRGERIHYEPTKDGFAIVGVKASSGYIKMKKNMTEKRKRRLLLNQIRKRTRAEQLDKRPARKLSIHMSLPQDLVSTDERELTIINPFTEEEDGIECLCKGDSRKPVGPHHGSPKRDDPYLITQLVDQPIMSAGQLAIRPKAEKPTQLVTNPALLFHVTYGKLLAKIHRTKVIIETGDTFFVPIGNTYSLANLRADTARLFYTIYKENGQFSDQSFHYQQPSHPSPADQDENDDN